MGSKKLSTGQMLGLGGGVLMVIALFLPWFTAKVTLLGETLVSESGNAFDFTLGLIGGLCVLAAAIVLAIAAFGSGGLKIGNLKGEQIALILAGLGTFFILLKLIIGESLGSEIEMLIAGDDTVSAGVSRAFGIFVGLIAGLAVTAGSFLTMKDKGLGLPDAGDFGIGGGDES